MCKTFIKCWPNVEDVGPTLYKCYTNVLCSLGYQLSGLAYSRMNSRSLLGVLHYPLVFVTYRGGAQQTRYNDPMLSDVGPAQHRVIPSSFLGSVKDDYQTREMWLASKKQIYSWTLYNNIFNQYYRIFNLTEHLTINIFIYLFVSQRYPDEVFTILCVVVHT